MRKLLVVAGLALLAGGVGAGCATGRAAQGAVAKDAVSAEFEAYLRAELPEAKVSWKDADTLEVVWPGEDGAEGLLALENVRQKVAAAEGDGPDAQARRDVYAAYVAMMRDSLSDESITAADAARLFPRIVSADSLAGITQAGGGTPIPTRPLRGTQLHVAYVLDSPRHVRFVNDKDLEGLGLTREALEQRALDNLRRLPVKLLPRSTEESRAGTMEEAVSLVVEQGAGLFVLTQDTFDAARLLLVPALLTGEQGLAALVPSRDTLLLLPMPMDDAGWAQLRETLAGLFEQFRQEGQPLSPVPMRVTAAGVAEVP